MFPGTTEFAVEDGGGEGDSDVEQWNSEDSGQLCLRDRENGEMVVLSRSSEFSISETALVRALMETFLQVRSEAAGMLGELRQVIVRRAISLHLARTGSPAQMKTVSDLIERLIEWSAQTYEGERVTAGVVIDRMIDDGKRGENLSLPELMEEEEFVKVLTDGERTWWHVDARGMVTGFGMLGDEEVGEVQVANYPLEYFGLAMESLTRIGLALNALGEVMVFSGGQLRFARRRGDWVHFSHLALIKILEGYLKDKELARAVYETCLDTSFERRGGCLGLLACSEELCRVQMARMVAVDDWLAAPANRKSRVAASIVRSRTFQEIGRRFRAELVAMDGAVLVSGQGNVLAAGAILALPESRRGYRGGRSAAARMLGEFGLGIKISADGLIAGYNAKGEVFRFG